MTQNISRSQSEIEINDLIGDAVNNAWHAVMKVFQ